MALDGVVLSNIANELENNIISGRIEKIYQPEKDEIFLQIRCFGKVKKLLLSANSSNPRIHFTNIQKENPINPPLFCMVLRKHILNGKIIKINHINFDRIIEIVIESIDELGEYSKKSLIIEIMGKHSNIILINKNRIILDSIKHISFDKSSVREVLPNKNYLYPPNKGKKNPIKVGEEEFLRDLSLSPMSKIYEVIYNSYNGISPLVSCEICFNSSLKIDTEKNEIDKDSFKSIFYSFKKIINEINNKNFNPQIIYKDKKILEFSSIELNQFKNANKKYFSSISELLDYFYKEKDLFYRLNQKTQSLKKVLLQNIDKCKKKQKIQIKTLKEIENREILKLYGELITANIYSIKKGQKEIELDNFYSENYEKVNIKLDPNLTPAENAQIYFKKYNKSKRTFDAIQIQISKNDEQIKYLENVLNSLNSCLTTQDIEDVRIELIQEGIIKDKRKRSKIENAKNKKSKPLHFITEDNFHIYVGKNNKQNDELTLKFAKPLDIWLHTKNIAGSHVIIVTEGKEVSSSALESAANLAAFYSKASSSSSVPVDYTLKKNVKKPNGSKPGMVIYETNKTIYITPTDENIEKLRRIE